MSERNAKKTINTKLEKGKFLSASSNYTEDYLLLCKNIIPFLCTRTHTNTIIKILLPAFSGARASLSFVSEIFAVFILIFLAACHFFVIETLAFELYESKLYSIPLTVSNQRPSSTKSKRFLYFCAANRYYFRFTSLISLGMIKGSGECVQEQKLFTKDNLILLCAKV